MLVKEVLDFVVIELESHLHEITKVEGLQEGAKLFILIQKILMKKMDAVIC